MGISRSLTGCGETAAAAIARIRLKARGFIGVSTKTRRVRPQFHPRANAAHGRNGSLAVDRRHVGSLPGIQRVATPPSAWVVHIL